MTEYVFTEQVKKYFHYLTEDYGFLVVEAKDKYDGSVNSIIKFRSSTTSIRIMLDRAEVLVDMGPYPERRGYNWFDMVPVIKFLAPSFNEPVYVFPEKWDDFYEMIDWKLVRLAPLLQQYCTPVLEGEFSKWEELRETMEKGALEDYRRLKGKDPIKIDSKEIAEKITEAMERRRNKSRLKSLFKILQVFRFW